MNLREATKRQFYADVEAYNAAEILTPEQAGKQRGRDRVKRQIVLSEDWRRARYRDLPPKKLPAKEQERLKMGDVRWAHMILDGITGPPHTSRVYLQPLETVGKWRGEIIIGGARCSILLDIGVLLNRDIEPIIDELLGAGTISQAREARSRVKGMTGFLAQNMMR